MALSASIDNRGTDKGLGIPELQFYCNLYVVIPLSIQFSHYLKSWNRFYYNIFNEYISDAMLIRNSISMTIIDSVSVWIAIILKEFSINYVLCLDKEKC